MHGVSGKEAPDIVRVKTVHILAGIDGLDQSIGLNAAGSGSWTRMP